MKARARVEDVFSRRVYLSCGNLVSQLLNEVLDFVSECADRMDVSSTMLDFKGLEVRFVFVGCTL